jgi:acid phosphatase
MAGNPGEGLPTLVGVTVSRLGATIARYAAFVACVGVLVGGCDTGSAGAGPAPRSTATPPATASGRAHARIKKVLAIVEENHSLGQMRAGMPYLYGLARQYGYATDYRAISHPSLPNYLAIAGGSTFGVRDDASPAAHPIHGASVFGQALRAGRSARLYAESMPGRCATASASAYAVKHGPWAYFVNERAACRAGMVPSGTPTGGALERDIRAGRLPTVGMLIPNLDDDAHDGSLAAADGWLRGWLPRLLHGRDFRKGRLAIVVTADEDDGSSANRVLTVVLAPGLAHRVVTTPLTHYSLTRFYDDVAHRRPLRAAAGATSLARAFGLRVAGG